MFFPNFIIFFRKTLDFWKWTWKWLLDDSSPFEISSSISSNAGSGRLTVHCPAALLSNVV